MATTACIDGLDISGAEAKGHFVPPGLDINEDQSSQTSLAAHYIMQKRSTVKRVAAQQTRDDVVLVCMPQKKEKVKKKKKKKRKRDRVAA